MYIRETLKENKIIRFLYNWICALFSMNGEKRNRFGPWLSIYRHIHYKQFRTLKKYKGIHEGERCFIVGTGPSLTLDDVNLIKGEFSFGVNTLFKIYDDTDWRADYYCIIDPNTYRNLEEEMKKRKLNQVFYPVNRISTEYLTGPQFVLDHSDIYRMCFPRLFKFTKFSENIEKKIYDGASVVYATLQIAVYMGFKEIYLLGVDCNYSINNTQHGENLAYKNYKYNWTANTGLTMIEGFKIARKYADKHGIKIYNATRGGMLEVFERVKLEEVLSKR